jgi:hypothetical protein
MKKGKKNVFVLPTWQKLATGFTGVVTVFLG